MSWPGCHGVRRVNICIVVLEILEYGTKSVPRFSTSQVYLVSEGRKRVRGSFIGCYSHNFIVDSLENVLFFADCTGG